MRVLVALILLISMPVFAFDSKDDLKSYLVDEISTQVKQARNLPYSDISTLKIYPDLPDKIAQLDKDSINSIWVDEVNNRSKRIKTSLKLENGEELSFNSRYEEFVEAPVLKSKINRGGVISADDIYYTQISTDRLKTDAILNEEEIIGKTVKNSVSAHIPLIKSALKEADLVEKNKSVTLIYQNKNLKIKMVGLALDSGTKNDMIRVKNLRSNAIVYGRVENRDVVYIEDAS